MKQTEVKSQHTQIIEKIKQKYEGSTSLFVCQDFVYRRVEDLNYHLAQAVISKFTSLVGAKDTYSDDEMLLLLLICIVAQNGVYFGQMEMKNFYKYKNKSLRLKQAKSKQYEAKSKPYMKEVKQKQEMREAMKEEKKDRKEEEKQKKVEEVIKKTYNSPYKRLMPVPLPPTIITIYENCVSGELPYPRILPPAEPQTYASYSYPPRKFSFGNDNEYETSISTKMVPYIQLDTEYKPTNTVSLKQSVDTPRFSKKSERSYEAIPNSLFTNSNLQLSTNTASKPRVMPQIRIDRYVKQTEYLSTVVRYEIKVPNSDSQPVLRRYSEFLKLQNYLRYKFQGHIIPELPPKEGIMDSLWSSSEITLIDRKKALYDFLNKCLAHEVIGSSPILLSFINDQILDYSMYNQQGIMTTAEKYISSLWKLTANTYQLKDYGIAYFSYIKGGQAETEKTYIEYIFQRVCLEYQKVISLKDYIEKVEGIVAKRHKIYQEMSIHQKQSKPKLNQFKKDIYRLLAEFTYAHKTFDDYCALRNNKKWLEHLYGAKINRPDQEKIVQELEEAESKIYKVSPLLEKEMLEFYQEKKRQWPYLLRRVAAWKMDNL